MRLSVVLPIWLATAAVGSPMDKRQSGMLSTLLNMLPSSYTTQVVSVQTLNPIYRPTAIRKKTRYGPFTLPANKDENAKPMEGGHSHGGGESAPAAAPVGGFQVIIQSIQTLLSLKPMDPMGFSTMKILPKGAMCQDCTVLAGKMSVVFENGTGADISKGVYLHHAIAVDMSKSSRGFATACPTNSTSLLAGKQSGGVNVFIGGAVDNFTQMYTTPDGLFNSGYYIKENNFMMQAEMINYRKEEQIVYVETDIEYVLGKQGSDSEQGVLSATGCDGNYGPWKPEKNSTGMVATDGYEIYRDGHIIVARGHMHDSGTGVNLYVNGNLTCASKAIYGGPGGTVNINGKTWATIAKMSECNEPIAVKKGDKLKLEATYDTKEHPLRESGGIEQENMGIMTMVFAPAP